MAPGPVIALPQKITGAQTPIKKNGISYVTVQAVNLDWAQYLWAANIEHSANLVSASSLGSSSALKLANYQMAQAKQSAAVVAYYLLFGKFYATPAGSTIISIIPGSPAAHAKFYPGDVITAVGGRPLATPAALVSSTKDSHGHRLTFSVLRSGRVIHISVTPVLTDGVYRIGASISNYVAPHLPKNALTINTSGVSGPSGGLMFTLALIDSLSPGDLTGGHKIAGTGTISSTPGSIGVTGPIGDVSYKIEAAISAHDQIFFVDPYDYAAAVAASHNEITVIPVANVYSALTWLCHAGATDKVCHELPQVLARLSTIPTA